MNRILVIPDVHQKIDLLNNALNTETFTDHTVFLGDYFDDFNDTETQVESMALWLKKNLYINSDKRTFLFGNHDFQYMLPIEGKVRCSGYKQWKHELIQSILTKEDWDKLQYFYSYKNFWFSHAGITDYWFAHPLYGVSEDQIYQTIRVMKSNISANNNRYDPLWAVDYYRGGKYIKGGILWNSLNNSEHFRNITQIIGHTPLQLPLVNKDEEINARNIFLDTHLKHYCVINVLDNTIEFFENKL